MLLRPGGRRVPGRNPVLVACRGYGEGMCGPSPAQVLSEGLDEEKGIPTSVIMLVEVLDPETGELHLLFRTDGETPAWRFLGMLETMAGDIRRDLAAEH